jgi:hypothetical protein
MRILKTMLIAGLPILLAPVLLTVALAKFESIALPGNSPGNSAAPAPLHLVDRALKGDRLLINVSKPTMHDTGRSQNAQAARQIPINPVREPTMDCDAALSTLLLQSCFHELWS